LEGLSAGVVALCSVPASFDPFEHYLPSGMFLLLGFGASDIVVVSADGIAGHAFACPSLHHRMSYSDQYCSDGVPSFDSTSAAGVAPSPSLSQRKPLRIVGSVSDLFDGQRGNDIVSSMLSFPDRSCNISTMIMLLSCSSLQATDSYKRVYDCVQRQITSK
jgi:hypothetical protein